MSTSTSRDFKQIYAVKIVGPAASHVDDDTTTALAFDVQGTKTKWRVVRTTEDFISLSLHFRSTSKIPKLPTKPTPLSLGKWLTSVFWLFKGRRGGAVGADRSLREFLQFLYPVQSDVVLPTTKNVSREVVVEEEEEVVERRGRDGGGGGGGRRRSSGGGARRDIRGSGLFDDDDSSLFSSLDDTDSNRTETSSLRTVDSYGDLTTRVLSGEGRGSASEVLGPTGALDDLASGISITAPITTTTAQLAARGGRRRRDTLDDTIANIVPSIVREQMDHMKRESEKIQQKMNLERQKHLSDRRSEQLLLQERYENLMEAAESDRRHLEKKLDVLEREKEQMSEMLMRERSEREVRGAREKREEMERDEREVREMREEEARKDMARKEMATSPPVSPSSMALLLQRAEKAEEGMNVVSMESDRLKRELIASYEASKKKQEQREELQMENVRYAREIVSVNEARAREVTLREVAENAVYEAESEIERHRVL